MERVQRGLYVLAVAIVLSTFILSWSVMNAAGTVTTGFSIASKLGVQPAAGSAAAAKAAATATAAPTAGAAPTQAAPVKLEIGNAPVKGDASAPVTIFEFSDFECPFCESAYSGAYKSIVTDYVTSGKVQIVFKNFPLSFHPQARPAAIAAECAKDQGKFWEMHDKLFENQAALGDASFKQWAKDLGLDSAKFDTCLASADAGARVDADEAEGIAAGVSGTPTFFVNGKEIVGAQPYAVFKQAIDAALAG